MNPNTNLEDVITDAVNDSNQPEPVEVDTPEVEATTETEEVPAVEAVEETPAEGTEEPVEETPEVSETPAQDEFARLVGIQQMGVGGRENRIPYSRVKKITEKAVSELAEAALGRKLNTGEKALDVVKAHVAQIPELTSKVTDYEGRLEKVGQFEHVMANEPERFLRMLSQVPAYKGFFEYLEQIAANPQASGGGPAASAEAVPHQQTSDPGDPMPEPNEELSDGTKVYNMEGLKELLAWNSRETERKVAGKLEGRYKELEQRYTPIEKEFRYRQHIESIVPVIRKQIEDARTWPLFTEHEDEITKALEADEALSLEGAYRKIVVPKLTVDRNEARQQVIKEIRTAPRATSVTGKATTPKPVQSAGPRDLTDIIKESIQVLK